MLRSKRSEAGLASEPRDSASPGHLPPTRALPARDPGRSPTAPAFPGTDSPGFGRFHLSLAKSLRPGCRPSAWLESGPAQCARGWGSALPRARRVWEVPLGKEAAAPRLPKTLGGGSRRAARLFEQAGHLPIIVQRTSVGYCLPVLRPEPSKLLSLFLFLLLFLSLSLF